MEEAFLLRLRHLLPKKFQYILVFDRGFGNLRILENLEKLGFNYVIRFKENTKIKLGIEEIKMSDLPKIADKYTNIQLKDEKFRNLIISVSKNKNSKTSLVSNF